MLKSFEKKNYQITIHLTKANIKEGCSVFNAISISGPLESTASHSPTAKGPQQSAETLIPNEINTVSLSQLIIHLQYTKLQLKIMAC